jgi:hypothetical protein
VPKLLPGEFPEIVLVDRDQRCRRAGRSLLIVRINAAGQLARFLIRLAKRREERVKMKQAFRPAAPRPRQSALAPRIEITIEICLAAFIAMTAIQLHGLLANFMN